LVTAASAKGRGAHVALIERGFMGGDCLNTGCVPSKAFLKCCNVAHSARTASEFGVIVKSVEIDFKAIMDRMKKIRADISENDSAERFSTNMGVDLFLGHAKFVSSTEVEINGQRLKFLKACIATGGRPFIPSIEGLSTCGYHTSDSIFNLTSLPASMLVLGCGPIGCELGQGFARLGT
jgi:pyruvate/2-oxoglutarate dehydrogenase complex dihydrolipoamide dehydrogenase (E3) component